MLCDQNDEDPQLFNTAIREGVEFIEQQLAKPRDVVVYCGLGVSRSASVVIAYVMKHQNLTFPEALRLV